MKYLCTSETLFATINQLNEFRKPLGDFVISAAEREVVPFVRSIKNTFFKPNPTLTPDEIIVLNRNVIPPSKPTIPVDPKVPFTFEPPVTYPITPYGTPVTTNPIVPTLPKEIMIPGRNRKGEIEPYRETKPKNAIQPFKFQKIKTDPEETRLKLRDEDPIVRKEESKLKDKKVKGKFPFPFGGIDTPNRGAGSINEPASISDLPLNLRVDSIGSYATRQRM
jgi:hypothetical protein